MNNAERHYQLAIKYRDLASQAPTDRARDELTARAQLEATLALYPEAQHRTDHFPLPESFFQPADDKTEAGQ